MTIFSLHWFNWIMKIWLEMYVKCWLRVGASWQIRNQPLLNVFWEVTAPPVAREATNGGNRNASIPSVSLNFIPSSEKGKGEMWSEHWETHSSRSSGKMPSFLYLELTHFRSKLRLSSPLRLNLGTRSLLCCAPRLRLPPHLLLPFLLLQHH